MSDAPRIENLGENDAASQQDSKFFTNIRKVSDEPKIPIVNSVQNPTGNTEIKTWSLDELTKDNTLAQVILETMYKYEEKMKPLTPVNKMEGALQQTTLYNTFLRVLKIENYRLFKKNWEIILSRFYENPNDVYSGKYTARFINDFKGTKEDLNFYLRLLVLISASADPNKRHLLHKTVSVTKVIGNVSNDTIRRNIQTYYDVDELNKNKN